MNCSPFQSAILVLIQAVPKLFGNPPASLGNRKWAVALFLVAARGRQYPMLTTPLPVYLITHTACVYLF